MKTYLAWMVCGLSVYVFLTLQFISVHPRSQVVCGHLALGSLICATGSIAWLAYTKQRKDPRQHTTITRGEMVQRMMGILGLIAFMTGCYPTSLHPIYEDDDDVVDNPSLTGEWRAVDDGKKLHSWTFLRKKDSKSYKLHIEYKNDTGLRKGDFEARLVKVGQQYYLDFMPVVDFEQTKHDFYTQVQMQSLHAFWRVDIKDDQMWLAMMSHEWLQKHLKAHPQDLKHEWRKVERDVWLLLTESTTGLRTFLMKHEETPGLWEDEPSALQRHTTEIIENLP